jgi:uncharacterized membrane protein YbhN (UPF0104 family)
VLYFVLRQIAVNWDEVAGYGWDIDPLGLILASLATVVALIGNAQVWRYLIAGFGYDISLGAAFRIIYLANLGRYIPGKVWAVAGMAYLARQAKIPAVTAVTASILAQVFSLPGALMLSFTVPLLYPELISPEVAPFVGPVLYACAAGTLIVSFVVVLFPSAALRILNLLLIKMKREPLTFVMPRALAVKVYLGYMLTWAIYALAFPIFLRALVPDNALSPIASAGAYILAYQVGFIALFSPGGLGVRELALTGMLSPSLGAPIAAGIALAARLWNLLVELLVSVVAAVSGKSAVASPSE